MVLSSRNSSLIDDLKGITSLVLEISNTSCSISFCSEWLLVCFSTSSIEEFYLSIAVEIGIYFYSSVI